MIKSNNPFDLILKVSVQYLMFWLSYIYLLELGGKIIIGHGHLGKVGQLRLSLMSIISNKEGVT